MIVVNTRLEWKWIPRFSSWTSFYAWLVPTDLWHLQSALGDCGDEVPGRKDEIPKQITVEIYPKSCRDSPFEEVGVLSDEVGGGLVPGGHPRMGQDLVCRYSLARVHV